MPETIIQAVLFVMTFNINTGNITHSQVYGGFPTLDACQAALPKVLLVVAPQLAKEEKPQIFCSGVRAEIGKKLVAPEGGAVL